MDVDGIEKPEINQDLYVLDIEDCSPDCVERTHCLKAGEPLHQQCGFCREHLRSRHHCGCLIIGEKLVKIRK